MQASVCVPPSEKQQPAYSGIAHWNELSFWQKRKRIPGTVEQLFFFFPFRSHAREASELFVGLSHISALTFRCLLIIKLFVFDLFEWNGFLEDVQLYIKNIRSWG